MDSVEDYDFSLAKASGQVIDSYTDVDQNTCSFTNYFWSLQFVCVTVPYIPEIKKKKENKSFMINGVPVEKGDRTINIKYSKVKHSLYSEKQSEVFANQYRGALMGLGVLKNIIHEYDPFEGRWVCGF
jgi:hypothetical protein